MAAARALGCPHNWIGLATTTTAATATATTTQGQFPAGSKLVSSTCTELATFIRSSRVACLPVWCPQQFGLLWLQAGQLARLPSGARSTVDTMRVLFNPPVGRLINDPSNELANSL